MLAAFVFVSRRFPRQDLPRHAEAAAVVAIGQKGGGVRRARNKLLHDRLFAVLVVRLVLIEPANGSSAARSLRLEK